MTTQMICSYCFEVCMIEKNKSYNFVCKKCGKSLLDTKPINANQRILEHFLKNSDLLVVVEFWAPWCGPCISMEPHFEKAALAMPLEAQFLKVNSENEQKLRSKFFILSIPTVLLFKEAKEIARFTGMRSSKQIQRWIKTYL